MVALILHILWYHKFIFILWYHKVDFALLKKVDFVIWQNRHDYMILWYHTIEFVKFVKFVLSQKHKIKLLK